MIDFSNIKSIVIPGGEVSVIARGDEILWRKQKYKCKLEYLESTGTQWIDTGLRLTQNSKLEMLISHVKGNNSIKIAGSRKSATESNFSVIRGTNNVVLDFQSYSNNRLSYIPNGDETLEISISKERLKTNDSERAVSTYSSFTTPANAYLFNCSGTYPAGYVGAAMRLYYCRIYDTNELIRDFVPVLDWNDMPRLYDKVTDELFYNQGTGEFLYG